MYIKLQGIEKNQKHAVKLAHVLRQVTEKPHIATLGLTGSYSRARQVFALVYPACWSKIAKNVNRAHNLCERMLTPGGCLADVPRECLFYVTRFKLSFLKKHNGNNEVPLFLRVDLMYYSLLSIFGISAAILLSF
jgi:hypothetical protein